MGAENERLNKENEYEILDNEGKEILFDMYFYEAEFIQRYPDVIVKNEMAHEYVSFIDFETWLGEISVICIKNAECLRKYPLYKLIIYFEKQFLKIYKKLKNNDIERSKKIEKIYKEKNY